jgi:hypothetical protein
VAEQVKTRSATQCRTHAQKWERTQKKNKQQASRKEGSPMEDEDEDEHEGEDANPVAKATATKASATKASATKASATKASATKAPVASKEKTTSKKAAVTQSRMVISMPSDKHLRPTTAEPLNSILYVLNGQVEQGTVVAKHKKAKAAKDGWFSVRTEDGAKQYLLFKPEGKGSVWDFGKLSGSYG